MASDMGRYGSEDENYDWETNPENRWIPPLTLGNQTNHPLARNRAQNYHAEEGRPKLIIEDFPIWLRIPLAIGFLLMIIIGSLGN
ncbi:MAG: hypothetical protein J0H98_04370 [Solirubrobacterales bacterium]|nr:hypothetical protein [Solirubrobacterales bacterium]